MKFSVEESSTPNFTSIGAAAGVLAKNGTLGAYTISFVDKLKRVLL